MVVAMMFARFRLIVALLVAGVCQSFTKEGATHAAPVSRNHSRGPLGVLSRSVHGGLEITVEDPSVHELLKKLPSHLAPTRSSSEIITGNPFVSAFTGHDGGRPVRRLQETCAPGDAFTLTSSIYPDAEGCYILVHETYDIYEVLGTNQTLAATTYSSSTYSSGEVKWTTGEVFIGTDGVLYIDADCIAEYVIGSHPTDADSWECFDGVFLVEVSGDSFNLECGCQEGTSSPSSAAALFSSPPEVAPTSSEATPAPSEVVPISSEFTPTPFESFPAFDLGCDGTDPFSITSELLPDLEGCYTDTGDVNAMVWSQTGELVEGEIAVYTDYVDQDEYDPRWFVGAYTTDTTDEEITATCVSLGDPSEDHPADTSWACDFFGKFSFSVVTDDQFLVACGCEATSTIDTPSPEAASSEPLGTNRGVERASAKAVAATLAFVTVSMTLLMA